MTKLSPAQIASVAASAGFTGAGLVRAVAVALAESGGDPNVIATNSDRYRSRDRGLWQINSHWHPEVSDAAALNPATAAAAAYRISKGGTDWHQWSTWNNGAAAAQFGRARIAASQAANDPAAARLDPGARAGNSSDPGNVSHVAGAAVGTIVAGPLGGIIGGISGASNPLDIWKQLAVLGVHAAAWMGDSHNWARVAMVAGGGVAVLLALDMLGRSGAAGSTAAAVTATANRAATKAAELAAVA